MASTDPVTTGPRPPGGRRSACRRSCWSPDPARCRSRPHRGFSGARPRHLCSWACAHALVACRQFRGRGRADRKLARRVRSLARHRRAGSARPRGQCRLNLLQLATGAQLAVGVVERTRLRLVPREREEPEGASVHVEREDEQAVRPLAAILDAESGADRAARQLGPGRPRFRGDHRRPVGRALAGPRAPVPLPRGVRPQRRAGRGAPDGADGPGAATRARHGTEPGGRAVGERRAQLGPGGALGTAAVYWLGGLSVIVRKTAAAVRGVTPSILPEPSAEIGPAAG